MGIRWAIIGAVLLVVSMNRYSIKSHKDGFKFFIGWFLALVSSMFVIEVGGYVLDYQGNTPIQRVALFMAVLVIPFVLLPLAVMPIRALLDKRKTKQPLK